MKTKTAAVAVTVAHTIWSAACGGPCASDGVTLLCRRPKRPLALSALVPCSHIPNSPRSSLVLATSSPHEPRVFTFCVYLYQRVRSLQVLFRIQYPALFSLDFSFSLPSLAHTYTHTHHIPPHTSRGLPVRSDYRHPPQSVLRAPCASRGPNPATNTVPSLTRSPNLLVYILLSLFCNTVLLPFPFA